MKKYINPGLQVLAILFTFIIFLYIGSKTPLAGDDWAFANNANNSGVLNSAISMFYGWEGRFMTLISIHFLIQYPMLWVIINAMMYAGIILIILKILKDKIGFLELAVLIFLVFSVKDNIRMEVYTWMTGSVYYGIPLFMSFIYLFILYLTDFGKQPKIKHYVLITLPAFYLPLGMENISIAVLITSLLILIESWIKERRVNRFIVYSIGVMLVSFIIWSISPGSSIRLSTMPEWTELSLFGKIFRQLPDVLYFTFFQNKEIVLLMSILVSLNLLSKVDLRIKYLSILIYAMSVLVLVSPYLAPHLDGLFDLNFLTEGRSVFNQVFWTIYALNLIFSIVWLNYMTMVGNKKLIYPLAIAFFSSAALFMSPVIGYRLMIYPVFYLSLILLMLLGDLQIKEYIKVPLAIAFLVLTLMNVNVLRIKYQAVETITAERSAILEDYSLYYDQYESGIWLPRYPIYTIHGGDIEFDDTYHMQAFKTYHKIPQDETITFYWKESY